MRTLLFLALVAPTLGQDIFNPIGNANDRFGESVALDGDTLIVGAPGDSVAGPSAGAVYMYERDEFGDWDLSAIFRPTIPALITEPVRFGTSVALEEGKWIVVGAPAPNCGVAGRAYVFTDVGEGWVLDQVLTSSESSVDDRFGQSVAVDGDRILVGAPRLDDYRTNQGGAELFEFNSPQFVSEHKFYAPFPQSPDDYFGFAVDLRGDRALIGAYGDDTIGTNHGAAYVFDEGANWNSSPHTLLPGEYHHHGQFGRSLSLADDLAIVGYPGAGASGMARVFRWVDPDWVGQDLTPTTTGTNSAFGQDVAAYGDRVLTTAPNSSLFGSWSGALVSHSGANWEDQRTVYGDPITFHGGSVSFSATDIAVGAPHWEAEKGAVYLYDPAVFFDSVSEVLCLCDQGPCEDNPDAGCPNSSGAGALLEVSGSPSILDDNLRLHGTGLPSGQLAMPLIGGPSNATQVGGGQLCLGGQLYRFPLIGTGTGTFSFGPGILSYAANQFEEPPMLDVGQTWAFQVWYRDPTGPCGATSNFTSGVSIELWP